MTSRAKMGAGIAVVAAIYFGVVVPISREAMRRDHQSARNLREIEKDSSAIGVVPKGGWLSMASDKHTSFVLNKFGIVGVTEDSDVSLPRIQEKLKGVKLVNAQTNQLVVANTNLGRGK